MLYSLEYLRRSEVKIHVQALFNTLLGEILRVHNHYMSTPFWGNFVRESRMYKKSHIMVCHNLYVTSVHTKIPLATC